ESFHGFYRFLGSPSRGLIGLFLQAFLRRVPKRDTCRVRSPISPGATCLGIEQREVRLRRRSPGPADKDSSRLREPPKGESLSAARGSVMPNPGQPTVGPGATGTVVRRVQRALRRTPDLGLVVDGIFGPETEAAVVDFQKGAGLAPDGIVWPLTWNALPD